MKLSKPQQQMFWREWSKAKTFFASQGHTPAQIENERYQLLDRAGFESLTEVDPLTGFDKVLAELKAITSPSDLTAQVRINQMERTRFIHAIKQLAQAITKSPNALHWESYVETICVDKFATCAWEALKIEQLEKLRNTLAARLASKKRKQKEGKDTVPVSQTSCSHVFRDTRHCVKCGWEPPQSLLDKLNTEPASNPF